VKQWQKARRGYWRRRELELRVKAERASDPVLREKLLRAAEIYEAMAEGASEDRLEEPMR
jgi:hypothetical protein